jgi:hypothetical protein
MDDMRKLKRRSVLKSTMLLAVAALTFAVPGKQSRAQQKASKEAMKYQDKPNGEMRCSNCQQFVPPSACKVVEGSISPDGYCIAWVKKS